MVCIRQSVYSFEMFDNGSEEKKGLGGGGGGGKGEKNVYNINTIITITTTVIFTIATSIIVINNIFF